MTDFKEGLGALLSEQNLAVTEIEPSIDVTDPIENTPINNDAPIADIVSPEIIKEKVVVQDKTTEPVVNDPIVQNNAPTGGGQNTVTEPVITEKTDPIVENPPITQRTLNELIAEKTQGKYKNYEEIESALTPKEVFANDQLRNINELIKNGESNMDEVLAYYGKDFSGMTDADSILKTEMKMSGQYEGWSDQELDLLIDDKYRRNEWAEDGEEKNSTQILQSKLFLRDSEAAKQKLIDKQNQLTISKEPTQAEQDAWKAEVEQGQVKWNDYVETELGAKVTKSTIMIDEKSKETFDYVHTDAERQGASEMMKSLHADMKFFWNQFNDAEGKLDYKKVYDMLLWNGSKDKMISVAVKNARAEGAEKEVRDSKNITLGTKKNEGTPQQVPQTTLADSLIQSKGY